MVEEYVKSSKFQYKDALEVIEEFGKEISEMKGKCIDIGCGPGNVTRTLLLPKLSPEVQLIGADISIDMIKYARDKYSDEKRLSFMCLDAETEHLPNELVDQFNHAFSFFCLHWCEKPWRSYKNIWKMLRPGGTAVTMFLGHNNGFDVYKSMYDNPLYRPYMQDVDRFVPYYHSCKDPRSSLRKHLEEIGFEILHCSKRQRSYVYQNVQSLKEHMTAVNPFLNRFPEELQDEFMDDIARGMMEGKIIFQQQNSTNKEFKILDMYDILVAHVRKPFKT